MELSHSAWPIVYCPVSDAEVWSGARHGEHDSIARLLKALECAAITRETGQLAGRYLHQYRKSHSLELADALIAASAVLREASLWTRNRKHYPMRDLTFFE